MASTSDRRGAGGKIVRNRRIPAASRTPYSRPPERSQIEEEQQDEEEQTQNPNWLSGLIYPAKFIASGAGKILSFFGNDSYHSSSDDDDSENEEEDDDDEVGNDLASQGDDRLNKVLSPPSKSGTKRTIEQLVMQETFSREEGNELIKLIKSRVVDTDGSFDKSAHMRTTAIMEARKWLQQTRSGSKKKVDNEVGTTNLATPSQVTRNEKGSPVDVAKSYMQNRPAWASPSSKLTEFGSPPPLGILNFKEETPKSTLRSSEMKRSSLSSGSWNILEEIRRVRSKATEELLAATPLTKTRLSSISSEKNPPPDSLMNNRDVGAAPAEFTYDRPQNVLSDGPAGLPLRVNQVADAVQSGECQEIQEVADLKSDKDIGVAELRSTAAENGFASTASGMAAGQDATLKSRHSEEENGNLVDVHLQQEPLPDVLVDVNLQQEPVVDVPDANPTDSVVNGSQNSSSIQHEELSQDLSQPIVVEQTSTAKANDAPKERKSRGYTRRGRGRGK